MNRNASIKLSMSLCLVLVMLFSLLVSILPVYAEAATDDYYASITATEGTQLLGQLHDLITTTHTKYTSYNDCKDPEIIKKTDPGSNSSSVMEFYSQADISSTWGSGAVGTWNREHVWCQSLSNGLWGESGGGSDLHHIRPVETRLNSTRGNDKYGIATNGDPEYYKDKNGNNVAIGGYSSGGTFEPLDQVKGDVARIVMYVYTHYNTYSNVGGTTNGSGGKFGTLNFSNIMVGSEDEAIEALLEWNELDPVDETERTRNDAVYEIQGNRNPFVDNESYADAIWGDGTVEEKPLTLNKTTLEMSVGETQTLIATTTESGTVSWTTSNPSVATVSGGTVKAVAEGSATITATIGEYTATCKITVTNTVAVDKTSVTLKVGESQTITATATGTVTWTSQDPTIATVDNGVITAVAKGKTVVTVTCGTAKTQINVTVIDESSGNTGSITITMDSFINYGGAYNYYNWEVDGVEGLAYLYKSDNNEMQFNKNKTAYYLASTSALPGRIVSVTVELSSGSDRDWKLLTSDSPYGKVTGAPTNGTDHGTKLVTTNGATWNIETGDTYFALSYMAASGACYLKSITVEYELGGSGEHTHTEVTIPGKAPTCTETGLTEGVKCSECGEILVPQQVIEKLPHTEVTIPGKAATCSETGLTDGKKCSVCGEITVPQQVIPVLPHSDENGDGMCDQCGREMAIQQYTVIVNGGMITGTDKTTALVNEGQTVSVTANAVEGKLFKGWSIDGGATIVSQSQTYTFTVTADVTVVAVFETAPQPSGNLDAFINAVQAISDADSKSEKFDAIKNAIALYNSLTEAEKATVTEQYQQLQSAIEDYNTVVQDVNSQVTKSLKSILLTTAFMSMALAGLLYLLERNRL